MENQTILMTGATSGFGRIIAKEAAKYGSTIIILARSVTKFNALIEEFHQENPDSTGSFKFIHSNLSSFKSVSLACQNVKKQVDKIDVFLNNAGIMNFEYLESEDNIEETLQVNLLSPLLILHLIYDSVPKNSNSKIIFTASGLHQGNIDFNNIEFKGNFSSFKAYRQSKLGVILLCRLLSKPLSEDGIGIYSIHPGMVRTKLGRNANFFSRMIFWLLGKSVQQGAKTHLFILKQKNSNLVSGEYYADNKVTKTTPEAYDLITAHKLRLKVMHFLNPYNKTKSIILNSL